jgi:hypothetical protein
MLRRFVPLAAIAALVTLASPAAAQKSKLEAGVDAAITFQIDPDNVTRISLPVSTLRLGFLLSDKFSLEPSLGFNYFNADNSSGSSLQLGLGGLFQLTGTNRTSGVYVRPFLTIDATSVDVGRTSNSETDLGIGAGLGYRKAVKNYLAWRVEGVFGTANTDPSTTYLQARGGLSVFF